jgi:hypothetical protein
LVWYNSNPAATGTCHIVLHDKEIWTYLDVSP